MAIRVALSHHTRYVYDRLVQLSPQIVRLRPALPCRTPVVACAFRVEPLGGCTHRVAHAGGRPYDTFPVNAYEAEARRGARFERFGHTPAPIDPPIPEADPQFPLPLDLRRRAT